jgi:adenosylhomocysteinase
MLKSKMKTPVELIRDYLAPHYRPEEWPTLLWQAEEWSKTRPLAGLRILDGTPIFRNTLAKYRALLAAGAELWVPAQPTMPCDKNIFPLLKTLRVQQAPRGMDDFDIILDCSGQFRELHPRLGFAELTRTGAHRFEHTHHPVILADSGRIKRIETTLGTGEAFFRAMEQLGHTDWAGKKLLIIGYGKVGRGLLHYAMKHGMKVTVADVSDVRSALPAQVNYVDASRGGDLGKAILNSWCTVTVTGHIAALRHVPQQQAIAASDVLLANMGVEDEFGPHIPESRVLNRKQPLNFLLEDPTSMRFIETTMALHNACALELLTADLPHRCMPPAPDVEDRLLHIACTRGLIGADVAAFSNVPHADTPQ